MMPPVTRTNSGTSEQDNRERSLRSKKKENRKRFYGYQKLRLSLETNKDDNAKRENTQ